jgi:hypothetical protein
LLAHAYLPSAAGLCANVLRPARAAAIKATVATRSRSGQGYHCRRKPLRWCGDAARSWPTPLGSDQTNTAATSSPYGRELGLCGLVGYRATKPVRQKREPEQSAKRPQHRKPLNAERLIIATVWIWIRNDQLETIQGHIRAFRFGSRLKIAYLLDKQTFTPKHLLPNDGTLS